MTTDTIVRNFELEVEAADGTTYLCNVEAHSRCYYLPGRLSGPPEDCYPAESEQETTFEILDCVLDGNELKLTPELLATLQPLLPVEWMEGQCWEAFMREDC